jgi:ferritin-like metal-binding protein YciE
MASKMTTVEDLLLEQIRDLYDAEKQLVRALPKMAKAAESDELREAIEQHLEETNHQVERLEQAFEQLEQPAKGKSCKGMKGLIEEGSEVMQENAEEPLSDLALIAAAQRVEHYEISAYGTARTMAEHLGQQEVMWLLEQSEEEEKAADSKLTEIAMTLMRENDGQSSGENRMDEQAVPASTSRASTRKPATALKGSSGRAHLKM